MYIYISTMKSDKSYCFCAMKGCNNNSRRNSLLRFFKFPCDPIRDEKDESHELVTRTNLNLTPLPTDGQSLVYYIGGFVQIRVLRNLKCYYCVKVVTENKINSLSTFLSKDVLNVCVVAECYLRTYFYNSVTDTFSKTFSCLDIFHKILMFCYRAIEGDVYSFRKLQNSVTCKCSGLNHRSKLIKSVLNEYLKLRLHYLAKIVSESLDHMMNLKGSYDES